MFLTGKQDEIFYKIDVHTFQVLIAFMFWHHMFVCVEYTSDEQCVIVNIPLYKASDTVVWFHLSSSVSEMMTCRDVWCHKSVWCLFVSQTHEVSDNDFRSLMMMRVHTVWCSTLCHSHHTFIQPFPLCQIKHTTLLYISILHIYFYISHILFFGGSNLV